MKTSIAAGGESMTLREIDFAGNVTHEIELVPDGNVKPTMPVATAGGIVRHQAFTTRFFNRRGLPRLST